MLWLLPAAALPPRVHYCQTLLPCATTDDAEMKERPGRTRGRARKGGPATARGRTGGCTRGRPAPRSDICGTLVFFIPVAKQTTGRRGLTAWSQSHMTFVRVQPPTSRHEITVEGRRLRQERPPARPPRRAKGAAEPQTSKGGSLLLCQHCC